MFLVRKELALALTRLKPRRFVGLWAEAPGTASPPVPLQAAAWQLGQAGRRARARQGCAYLINPFEFMAASLRAAGFSECKVLELGQGQHSSAGSTPAPAPRAGDAGEDAGEAVERVAFPAIVMEISSCFPGGHHLHNS